MRKLKSVMAALLALVVLFGLNEAAFAAIPSAADKGSITIKGIDEESGITVVAYPIVLAQYDPAVGLTAYKNVDGFPAFEDPAKPTPEEWEEVLKVAEPSSLISLQQDSADKTSWTASNLTPGLYVVKVKGSSKLYNPMLAGIYYTAADGTALANGEINLPSDFRLEDATVYAKKSAPSVDKATSDLTPEVETLSKGDNDALEVPGQYATKGNGAQVGKPIAFQIKTMIPSYAKATKNLTFKITDTLTGLTLDTASVKVYVGKTTFPTQQSEGVATDGTPFTATSGEYTVNAQAGSLEVNFSDAYLKAQGAKTEDERAVLVTYQAKITDASRANFVGNTNEAKITYTTDPTTGATKETEGKKTYHYTFSLGGFVNGEGSEETWDITKHGNKMVKGEQQAAPLSGAKFGLFTDPEAKTQLKTADGQPVETVSDGKGKLKFEGLDEGVYYLKELQAPDGYALNNKIYKVEIRAVYETDGQLKEYSIWFENTQVTRYGVIGTLDGGKREIGSLNDDRGGMDTDPIIDKGAQIQNTTLSALPSTGGVGTYAFIAIGVALMAGGFTLFTYIAKKKRNLKAE